MPTGDVALLKLNASAVMDDYTGTIEIDDNEDCTMEDDVCTIYGWGQKAQGKSGQH